MQRFIVALILLISLAYAQHVGGTSGPCSATYIPPPYNKALTVFSSNVGAQTYSNNSCIFTTSSPFIWFNISPPSGANITLTTCNPGTDFDTVLFVYNGSCEALSCVGYDDDSSCLLNNTLTSPQLTSTVSFISTGSDYYFAVSGYSASTGNFQLKISQSESQGSDQVAPPGCVNATRVYGPYLPEITVFANNYFGQNGFDGFNDTGCPIYNNQYTVWYQIFPTVGSEFNITTCNTATNFDTVLAVFEGSSCSDLACTIRNDDSICEFASLTSFVSFIATSESYFVAVSGYYSNQGTYEVSFSQGNPVSDPPTPPEDPSCLSATEIEPYNLYYGNNYGAPGLVDACNVYNNRSAVWYQLYVDYPRNVTVTTCLSSTNFDTVLLVYSGSCSALSCVAYNDDDFSCSVGSTKSTVTFFGEIGTYYVIVASYGATTGFFELDVQ